MILNLEFLKIANLNPYLLMKFYIHKSTLRFHSSGFESKYILQLDYSVHELYDMAQ